MQPQLNYLTLAVDDLARSFEFYHGLLGWPSKGLQTISAAGDQVAFFQLHNGLTLALWGRQALADFCHVELSEVQGTGVLLSHNFNNKAEFEQTLAKLANAGVLAQAAKPLPWGGSGAIMRDPDGYLWELVLPPT